MSKTICVEDFGTPPGVGMADAGGRVQVSSRRRLRLTPMARHIGVLLGLLLASNAAKAVELGELEVRSALNEPLNALIALNGMEQGGAECFKGGVASLEGGALGKTRIKLIGEGAARKVLLRSDRAIFEPAVAVSIEFVCGAGARREYQVILDPALPTAATAAKSPVDGSAVADEGGPVTSSAKQGQEVHEVREVHEGREGHEGPGRPHIAPVLKQFLSTIIPSAQAADLVEETGGSAEARIDAARREVALLEQEQQVLEKLSKQTSGLLAKQRGENGWALSGAGPQPMFLVLVCAGAGILLLWGLGHRVPGRGYRAALRFEAVKRGKRARKSHEEAREAKRNEPAIDLDQPIPYEPPVVLRPTKSGAWFVDSLVETPTPIEKLPECEFFDNHEYFNNVRTDLPVYSVEVVADEFQLARFWMEISEHARAIEVLEAGWAKGAPESEETWLTLFELYRITGEAQKHAGLARDFEQAFRREAPRWSGVSHLEPKAA
ncbi:MAG TPA: hypothetical protein VF472_23620 [Burkholderiaceae bacterium]